MGWITDHTRTRWGPYKPWIAVGVVMHRYSLPRDRAWHRLLRLAREQGLDIQQQAERLVQAVEELSRGAEG